MQLPATERRTGASVSRTPPSIKLGTALALVLFICLLPRRLTATYGIVAGILLFLWPLCRMPFLFALRRLLVMEFFIAGVALLSLLTPSATPVVLAALAKSNLCVFTMLLLIWTTPFHDILGQLRKLRMPTVMLTTLALMYRFLPVLLEESRRMQRARASRTFSRRRRLAWDNLAAILGQLFIRSAERAERIYLAMCARGWK
jgi:cobalt/nickel transport system permease protein